MEKSSTKSCRKFLWRAVAKLSPIAEGQEVKPAHVLDQIRMFLRPQAVPDEAVVIADNAQEGC